MGVELGDVGDNIPDAAVTSDKLATDAVTNVKVANNAITGDKIALGSDAQGMLCIMMVQIGYGLEQELLGIF